MQNENRRPRRDCLSFGRLPVHAECAKLYRATLLEDIAPFWLGRGIDRARGGGLHNMLDDAGNVVGTDKFLWSQGRGLWTFSALCNRIDRRAEWLAVADHIFRYLTSIDGRDEQGRWVFRLDKEGKQLEGNTSIYVDGFVMAGMTEYFAATKDEIARRIALETYENALKRIKTPGSYQLAPYHLPPGMKTHGVAMIFSFFFYELGQLLGRDDITQVALDHAYQVLNHFYRPEKGRDRRVRHAGRKVRRFAGGRRAFPGTRWSRSGSSSRSSSAAATPHRSEMLPADQAASRARRGTTSSAASCSPATSTAKSRRTGSSRSISRGGCRSKRWSHGSRVRTHA
jgi:hypothetical protein